MSYSKFVRRSRFAKYVYNVTPREIVKLLEANRFELVSSNGSHSKYRNPATVKTTIVPFHAKVLKPGSKKSILKTAGIQKQYPPPKGDYFMRFVFYPVIFHPEEVGYSVTVPDIEGCFTQGDDINEAVAMAQDAIGLMLEDCKVYPKPSNPADLYTEPGEFVAMVPFDEAAYKKQQKFVKKC